jgi:hypothetical protein
MDGRSASPFPIGKRFSPVAEATKMPDDLRKGVKIYASGKDRAMYAYHRPSHRPINARPIWGTDFIHELEQIRREHSDRKQTPQARQRRGGR